MAATSPQQNDIEPKLSSRASDARLAAVVGGVLSLVYLWRMLPGPGYAGDTVKFQFVGPTGGTAHETGYPVYLALTWIASRVPIGSIAWRVNALSAVFAVAACVLMYFVLRRLGTGRGVAAAFSVGLGLVPVVLRHAVVAEVYSLHLALMLAMLLVLLVWQERRDDWQLYLLMVIAAFSFGNHMTTSLLLPGILVFLWKVDRKQAFSPRMIAAGALAGLASMATYGYLMWRASDPSVFYLEITPQSIGDLVDIWLGGRFRGKFFGLSIDRIAVERLPELAKYIGMSVIALLPLVAYGYRRLRGTPAVTLLLWWGGTTLVFSVTYDILDIPPYVIPLMAVFVVFAAVGAEPFGNRWIPTRPIRVALLIGAIVALTSPSFGAKLTDWSESAVFEQDINTWLTELPPNSLLAGDYRDSMGAWNLMSIGAVETTVEVLHSEAEDLDGDHTAVLDSYMLGNPGYSRQLRQVIEPGKVVFAPSDEWMCVLVSHGFALEKARDRLYRVLTPRGVAPVAERWSPEMRQICIEIDPEYADL